MPYRRLGIALGILLSLACRGVKERSAGGYAGVELEEPRPKPGFVLQDTAGEPYDFRSRTDGRLTLLFFGYTNCPDICPVHMSNLAAVLHRLPADVTRRVAVVFVTTDPARDTPERLADWLGRIDPGFIGLTGSPEDIQRAQLAAGVAPAVPASASWPGADYAVGHAAQVIAYTPDGMGRVVYPAGTRQKDWAHDIPLLVRIGVAQ